MNKQAIAANVVAVLLAVAGVILLLLVWITAMDYGNASFRRFESARTYVYAISTVLAFQIIFALATLKILNISRKLAVIILSALLLFASLKLHALF